MPPSRTSAEGEPRLVMAALYRSVICPCSAIWSWAPVARIDRDVKISAITAARPGSAVTEICIQSRGSRAVTGRPGRPHLGRTRRRVARRGARHDGGDDCPLRPVRLGGMCLSELIGAAQGSPFSHRATVTDTVNELCKQVVRRPITGTARQAEPLRAAVAHVLLTDW